ncbi:diacylglycerol kinase 3-like isoform X2 [Diospyros lotus]|uniref:diacylglycerol kinase 3-like isoform X2 n=1 Tax=Diospyros lotus TaxID=55363 RepID=UPI002253F023|nr:diacylglycerol kinase 3-like isoform X2 [Diospyros lotus]
MDSSAPEASRRTARASLVESVRDCTLAGVRISKEELRRKLTMPEYLRLAVTDAIESKDIDGAADRHRLSAGESAESPEFPLVVFINRNSGGRHGPKLKARLQDLMAKEQVAGGDGTVGWVLGCLGELHVQRREPVPPTAVIPLGTGNDLSRSFGWGGSFPFNWKSAIKNTLDRAGRGQECHLDSWNISISMPAKEIVHRPHCLKPVKECYLDQGLEIGVLPEKVSYYKGVFYNYFSIGMDAQVAYGFHNLREKKPHLAKGPVSNKLIYSGYTCAQGWFFAPCMSDPKLRGLNNILKMFIKKTNCSNWEEVSIPPSSSWLLLCNRTIYSSPLPLPALADVTRQKGPSCHQQTPDSLSLKKPAIALILLQHQIIILLLLAMIEDPHQISSICSAPDLPLLAGLCWVLLLLSGILCLELIGDGFWHCVRSIVALNLNNYASGRNPWGKLKPDYLEKRGFRQARVDDGLLEIFGLKQGWHASFVMADLISAKHIAQAAMIRFEFRGGERKEAYLQMDGEPWKQPIVEDYSAFVEIKGVPFRSVMINGTVSS